VEVQVSDAVCERRPASAIDDRLRGIETRQRRLLRLITAGCLLVPLVLAVMGAGKRPRIDAEEVVIRDAAGRVRIRMGMVDTTEAPVLGGRVGTGSSRPPEVKKGKGPGVFLYAEDGTPAAELLLFVDGAPSLVLRDAEGASHARLAVDPLGSAHLAFTHRKGDAGEDSAFLAVQADRGPYLWLADSTGKAFEAAPRPGTVTVSK
jgi:hypothetical protein